MRMQLRPLSAALLVLMLLVGGPCPRLLAGTVVASVTAESDAAELETGEPPVPACPLCRRDAGLPAPEPSDDDGCPCNLRGNPGFALMSEVPPAVDLPVIEISLDALREGTAMLPSACLEIAPRSRVGEPPPDPASGVVALLL